MSQYRFGLSATDTGVPTGLTQLQVNAPNLPLFSQGTMPFLGDYVDVAGQAFKANGAGVWSFNTSASSPFVAYASWTDNRDVKPPLDGNWANYTATGPVHQSVADPSKQTPPCVVGQEGMRNQNVYSSRISEGLVVGSPQNVKPLSPTLQRSFVVTLQNLTASQRTFRLTVTQPPGGQASFLQTSSQTTLDVTIAPAVRRRAPGLREGGEPGRGLHGQRRGSRRDPVGLDRDEPRGFGLAARAAGRHDRRHRDPRDLHSRLPGRGTRRIRTPS